MKAKICNSWDELVESGPGAVMFNEAESRLLFVCPNAGAPDACSGVCNIPVNKTDCEGKPAWQMTGWPDAVTLSPSVYNCAHSQKCQWHGWLRNGEWVSV